MGIKLWRQCCFYAIILALTHLSLSLSDTNFNERKNIIQRTKEPKQCENDGLGSSKALSQKCLVKHPTDNCKIFAPKNNTNCDQVR